MWVTIIDFFQDLFGQFSKVWQWLATPLPVVSQLIGVSVSPLALLGSFLVAFLGVVFTLRVISLVNPAS